MTNRPHATLYLVVAILAWDHHGVTAVFAPFLVLLSLFEVMVAWDNWKSRNAAKKAAENSPAPREATDSPTKPKATVTASPELLPTQLPKEPIKLNLENPICYDGVIIKEVKAPTQLPKEKADD